MLYGCDIDKSDPGLNGGAEADSLLPDAFLSSEGLSSLLLSGGVSW